MNAYAVHAWVIGKDGLRPISVMMIPVYNEDALKAVVLLSMYGA